MLRCERSVGVSGNIPMGFSGVLCDGDEVYQNELGEFENFCFVEDV